MSNPKMLQQHYVDPDEMYKLRSIHGKLEQKIASGWRFKDVPCQLDGPCQNEERNSRSRQTTFNAGVQIGTSGQLQLLQAGIPSIPSSTASWYSMVAVPTSSFVSFVVIGTLFTAAFLQIFGATIVVDIFMFMVYIVWSSALLFVNKGLIAGDACIHPVILVALHMLACFLVTRL